MSNITKVTTAGSALEVALSTYGLKDVSNINISWNLSGSVDNKSKICKDFHWISILRKLCRISNLVNTIFVSISMVMEKSKRNLVNT